MNRILDELRTKWDLKAQFKSETNRYLAIYNSHAQEWYLGWSVDKRKELILVTRDTSKLSDVASSRFITISERKIEQQKYLLCFTLIDESVYEVYLKLCEDLIEQVKEETNTSRAQKIVLERFNLWKKMLERKPLSVDEYKGVLGELLLIRDLLQEGIPAVEVINAWTGPEFTEQDFVFPSSWYEAKAVTSGAMVVTINSAGQLDHPGDGWLCVYHLDKQQNEGVEELSIKKLVELLRKEFLSKDAEAQLLFDEKLYQFEYAPLTLEDNFWFTFSHKSLFKVTEDFPKLTHSMKRSEMQSIKYNLILSALEPWRVQ